MRYMTKERWRCYVSYFYQMPLMKDERASVYSQEIFKEVARNDPGYRGSDDEEYRENLWIVQNFMPMSVLTHTADTRMLALGHIAPQNYRRTVRAIRKLRRQCDRAATLNHRHLREKLMGKPTRSVGDSYIASFRKVGADLFFTFHCLSYMPNSEYTTMRMLGGKLEEEDADPAGLFVLFDELYRAHGRYQWHWLCATKKNELKYLTFSLDGMTVFEGKGRDALRKKIAAAKAKKQNTK